LFNTKRTVQMLTFAVLFSGMTVAAQTTTTSNQGATAPSKADRAFVEKALQGGNAEIQLGQLASQKSDSEDVKQFGQKMVTDHTQLGDQLKPIAQQLSLPTPDGVSANDKAVYAKLNALSGSEFDREYIKTMVKDHHQDLKKFRSETASTQNPDLKQAAQKGATVFSEHLQLIQKIAQKHNVSGNNTKEMSSNP